MLETQENYPRGLKRTGLPPGVPALPLQFVRAPHAARGLPTLPGSLLPPVKVVGSPVRGADAAAVSGLLHRGLLPWKPPASLVQPEWKEAGGVSVECVTACTSGGVPRFPSLECVVS